MRRGVGWRHWLSAIRSLGVRGPRPNRPRPEPPRPFSRLSVEALEDRLTPATTVQFAAASETAYQTVGSFRIPVALSQPVAPIVGTFASGFSSPQGLAFDAAGNLYVANAGNVSEVTPGGVVSTFAVGFNNPEGLAFDAAGNLYVANAGNGTVIEVTPAGAVSTFAAGFSGSPQGLAFDGAGNLFVGVNNFGNGTVSKVAPGGAVSRFAAGFYNPQGLAFDTAGNLYVANANGTVSEVTPGGAVSTFANLGNPTGLAFDAAGNLFVNVNVFGGASVVEVAPGGVVSTVANLNGTGGQGIAFDAVGNLYVANVGNRAVAEIGGAVTVPFTLGGDAVAGADYANLTAGPLTFAPGQTTAYITGTLPADLGADKTLTFTLGTPTGTVTLGSPSTNTLTVDESGANPAPTLGGASPGAVGVGAGITTITVTGSNFVAGFRRGLQRRAAGHDLRQRHDADGRRPGRRPGLPRRRRGHGRHGRLGRRHVGDGRVRRRGPDAHGHQPGCRHALGRDRRDLQPDDDRDGHGLRPRLDGEVQRRAAGHHVRQRHHAEGRHPGRRLFHGGQRHHYGRDGRPHDGRADVHRRLPVGPDRP